MATSIGLSTHDATCSDDDATSAGTPVHAIDIAGEFTTVNPNTHAGALYTFSCDLCTVAETGPGSS